MAWSEKERNLDEALSADIDGWTNVYPPIRFALLWWILEDRKHGPKRKAEVLMANREASDGEIEEE